MRGFLGGVSVGALLAAGGLAMLSLSVPLPVSGPDGQPGEDQAAAAPQPAEAQPAENRAAVQPDPAVHEPGDAPQLPDGGNETAEIPGNGQGRDADLVEAQPAGPAATGSGDDLSALAGTDTAPAGKPEVGLAATSLEGSSPAPAAAPGLDQGGREGLPQAAKPSAPQAPGSEAAVIAATDPAPEPEQPAQEPDTAAQPQDAAPLPAVRHAPDTQAAAAVLAPDIGAAPQATTLPVIGAAPSVPDASAGDDALPSEAVPEAEAPQQEALAPRIGTPVVPLTDRDDAQEIALAAAQPLDNPPFQAFSEPFHNPEDRPLMSIVLIDDAGAVGAEALAAFPYPLSFAIDPGDPDAEAKMAARRAAGFEVLMLADLPRAATPQDAEMALEVWRSRVPEAVAILEGVETGVQGNRPLADQVAAMAASAGYGLVTQNSGLNTVQRLALRDGVPAGVVFRDFDGAGQTPRAIRRFLDQAAFRAGQEGSVIMLGRLRPDTISALLIWGLEDRAARVALAPVSASLEAQLPPK